MNVSVNLLHCDHDFHRSIMPADFLRKGNGFPLGGSDQDKVCRERGIRNILTILRGKRSGRRKKTHSTSLDFRPEFKSRTRLARFEFNRNLRELPRASTLLLVSVFNVCHFGDGLPVVHLWGTHVAIHIEFPSQPVYNDILQYRYYPN